MKSLLEEHRIKKEKAISEHQQNEFLRMKQENEAWLGYWQRTLVWKI